MICKNCNKTILNDGETYAGDPLELCKCCVHDRKPIELVIEPQIINRKLGEDYDALDFIDLKLNEIIDWINEKGER